ncbi:MAG: adenylate/guanylate cyclase domain-containing protein [Endomicrobiia bacterium]|nr:adenylate/guanylate cyclase domain-containing protein [Endomicrobiia bacterium]
MNKKKKISFIIAGAVLAAVSLLWLAGLFTALDNSWSDFKFILRGPLSPDKNIIIVAIDEHAIKMLGRWPWPRRTHARLIERLTRAGAKAIIFDVLFTEPDRLDPAGDAELTAAARKSRRTILGGMFQFKDRAAEAYLVPVGETVRSPRVGFVNIFPELDGKCRKVPLFIEYRGAPLPSLALRGLEIYYQKSADEIVSERRLALDDYGELTLNYRGGFERFEYISFYDVVSGKSPRSAFKGKIVLVGGTAAALFDLKATPYSPVFPGVEIHANAISNVINSNFLHPVSWLWAFLAAALLCAAGGYFMTTMSAWKGSMVAASMIFGYLGLSYAMFLGERYFNYTAPAVAGLFCYVGILLYRFFTEEKEKKYIKKTFSHYLSPHVMEDILNNPASLKLGGQKQTLSVLFSDIRGFTTMSENLKAEEVVALLNEYLTEMVKVVFKHDGTLDKFMGDAVMAFWGAPIPQNDHAVRAVSCARDMIINLRKLQEKWLVEGKTSTINIGIGVNTGEMVVGNMGSYERMDYTVIGDNVNLGARLEGLNKDYATEVIISEFTYAVVRDIFKTKYLDEVKVKGKAKPVKIYAVEV